uniref:SH3 domain-containing protein n=1 Tax=Steinernema glaseri TaxID=37863 RepID=A0A1I8AF21_9BILA
MDPRNPARKKWNSTFRVLQSLHRLRCPPERHNEPVANDAATTNAIEEVVDPVYLALKQATGKYGRRGSSAHNFADSASPSPRNLSQVSLQDSGYAEASSSQGQLLGSTPQLDISGSSSRRRAPKLNKQMKSLSLDCAEMPPPVNNALRSPYRNKPSQRTQGRGYTGSGEMSDWERSCSPNVPSPRRLPSSPAVLPKTTRAPSHIVIHEYLSGEAGPLYLGDRMHIVDNGDPDWLHGFKDGDRLEQLITFPSTCVAAVHSGEQPMRITQNVYIPDAKLRLYRDQVVFAQADSIRDGRVLVRNEHNALANCPLQYLTLL